MGYSSLKLDKFLISMQNARMGHAQQAQISGSVCFVRAYARTNLTLDISGRRADGYHELATVMQTVDLYDALCLTATDDARARDDLLDAGAPFVRLSGSGPTLFAPFSELACAGRVQAQGYEVHLSRAIHPDAGYVCLY
jgi:4-diphosphocytidyl-2C-methyl-D-erythritol kinase